MCSYKPVHFICPHFYSLSFSSLFELIFTPESWRKVFWILVIILKKSLKVRVHGEVISSHALLTQCLCFSSCPPCRSSPQGRPWANQLTGCPLRSLFPDRNKTNTRSALTDWLTRRKKKEISPTLCRFLVGSLFFSSDKPLLSRHWFQIRFCCSTRCRPSYHKGQRRPRVYSRPAGKIKARFHQTSWHCYCSELLLFGEQECWV